jgi:hypothetical protein
MMYDSPQIWSEYAHQVWACQLQCLQYMYYVQLETAYQLLYTYHNESISMYMTIVYSTVIHDTRSQ